MDVPSRAVCEIVDAWANLTLQEVTVGIIGALVVAGLGYLAGVLRSRIRQRAVRRQSQRELSAFGERMLSAGASNFYSGRDDWARYRRPADLGAYLRTAQHSVDIACYWMAQGVLSGIPRVLGDLAEQGLSVRVVTIDPKGPAVNCLTSDLELSSADIRKNVRQTIVSLLDVKSQLSQQAKPRFQIGTTQIVPQAAVILLDCGRDSCVLQLEFRPYRTPRSHSFSLEFRRRDSGVLERSLEASWTKFFDDSRPVSEQS